MATARKRKTLPSDFEQLLRAGDLDALKAVFDKCAVDATGGYGKQTALAFAECPDALAHWLVAQGADIEARDSHGATPLHSRAGHWQGNVQALLDLGADVHARDNAGNTPLHGAARVGNAKAARELLARGARTDATNGAGQTPLGLAVAECRNARITAIADVAAILLHVAPTAPTGVRGLAARLLGGGPASPVTAEMKAAVTRIGTDFEFHRAGYNPDHVDEASAGLDRLYAMFGVTPVPRRVIHAGGQRIVATATTWQARHDELWQLLVPSRGAAHTVQGEVIRISGRMHIELIENGGANWDADYGKMARALLRHIGSGMPLPEAQQREAGELVAKVRNSDEAASALARLAVAWVDLNPTPIPLPPVDYTR